MSASNYTKQTPKEKVSNHAFRILKKLGCDKTVREEAMSLIERADAQGLLAKGTPKGVASGVVYIACILREDRMTLDSDNPFIDGLLNSISSFFLSNSVLSVSKSFMII